MKHILSIIIALMLFISPAYSAEEALQIDALWSGIDDPSDGEPFSGAIVAFFAAGTTTPKAVWENKEKTIPSAAGQFQDNLDSNGQLKVFGDGIYKINIYHPNDTGLTTPKFTIEGVSYINSSGSIIIGFDTIADMRAGDGGDYDGQGANLKGYYAVNDGGGRGFYWDPVSVETDDGATVIKATPETGRWKPIESEIIIAEQFGLVGDDSTDNTTQARILFNFGKSISFRSGGVYLMDYNTIDSINNIVIYGNGATIKRLATSAGADYGRGALLAFMACNDITVKDLTVDGNRLELIATTPGNVSMNHGISIYGNNAVGSDVQLDNGGEDKGSKNITIDNCKFYRSGSNKAGADKFGDGITMFGVDGVTITNCYFEDSGRWGISGGDVFNLEISGNNRFNHATTGTLATALGSIDIENESADSTNGSYSRNIIITGIKAHGRVTMCVNARASAANAAGADHYIRDIRITDNVIETEYSATYGLTGICVYVTIEGTTYPSFTDAVIERNTVKSIGVTPVTWGILVQPETDDITTSDVSISHNEIKGCENGIFVDSTDMPVLTNYKINSNSIISGYATAETGIYVEGEDLRQVEVSDNYIRDYGLNGIVAIRTISGIGLLKASRNAIYEGLATFTGNGIRLSGDVIICDDNFVDISTGNDYDVSADTKIICNNSYEMQMIEGILTMSGASVSFTNAIPAGAMVMGVSSRVTTAITGATSFDIGIATDTDRYGLARSPALNATTDLASWTVTTPFVYTSTQSLIFTANGSAFTGGQVKVRIHYFEETPPFKL